MNALDRYLESRRQHALELAELQRRRRAELVALIRARRERARARRRARLLGRG